MSESQKIPQNPAFGLVPFREYVRARPQFFPRAATQYYFLRFRRRELLESGVMVRTASGDLVQPTALDEYILELGRRGETYRCATQFIED